MALIAECPFPTHSGHCHSALLKWHAPFHLVRFVYLRWPCRRWCAGAAAGFPWLIARCLGGVAVIAPYVVLYPRLARRSRRLCLLCTQTCRDRLRPKADTSFPLRQWLPYLWMRAPAGWLVMTAPPARPPVRQPQCRGAGGRALWTRVLVKRRSDRRRRFRHKCLDQSRRSCHWTSQ